MEVVAAFRAGMIALIALEGALCDSFVSAPSMKCQTNLRPIDLLRYLTLSSPEVISISKIGVEAGLPSPTVCEQLQIDIQHREYASRRVG
jgi:hypothetical protein